MDITGRKLFVKALQEEGVDTIFGYPGGTVTVSYTHLDVYKRQDQGKHCYTFAGCRNHECKVCQWHAAGKTGTGIRKV